MIIDFIILGLGNIIGFELILATMIVLGLMVTAMSRGLGTTSLIVTFMLTVFLLSSYPIGEVFLLSTQFSITVFLVLAFFIGLMFYTLIIRE